MSFHQTDSIFRSLIEQHSVRCLNLMSLQPSLSFCKYFFNKHHHVLLHSHALLLLVYIKNPLKYIEVCGRLKRTGMNVLIFCQKF